MGASMTVINTNVSSLNAQAAMASNARGLSKAMAQLSTGKRINSASDDAAGLAISDKLTAQIRGLNQAVRNANDAISMLQTAEGATNEITNMLQRMRELAVQSANDTNTDGNRSFLDLEFQQLKEEINRIGKTVEWNGTKILDGSFAENTGTFRFQVGANADQTISTTVDNMTTGNQNIKTMKVEDAYTAGNSVIFSDGTNTVKYTVSADASASKSVMAAEIAELDFSSLGGVLTVSADGDTVTFSNDAAWAIDHEANFTLTAATTKGTSNADTVATAAGTTAKQVSTFTFALPSGGYKAGDALEFTDGTNKISYVVTSDVTNNTELEAMVADITANLDSSSLTDSPTITVDGSNAEKLTFTFTTDNVAVAGLAYSVYTQGETLVNTAAVSASLSDAHFSNVKDQEAANDAIKALDLSLDAVNAQRATMGATVNRLQYAVDNWMNVSTRSSEARSRIEDTDYAQATMELAKRQIIQQAATAMLAQANQQPQQVLTLLK